MLLRAFDSMQKEIFEQTGKVGKQRRESYHWGLQVQVLNFDVKDFVVRGSKDPTKRRVMKIKWNWPHQISCLQSDHVYALEDQLTWETDKARATRMKLVCNAEMEVDQEVTEYLCFRKGQYCGVDKLLDLK